MPRTAARRFRSTPIWLLVALLLAAAPGSMGVAVLAADARTKAEQTIYMAFGHGDFERAKVLIGRHLERWPDDPNMHYNLACAHAQLYELDESAAALKRAIEKGFRDFDHMMRDPDLEPIHQHEVYLAIVEAALRTTSRSAADSLSEWKQRFGEENYRYEVDRERKIAIAAALDDVAFEEMKAMLKTQEDHMLANLFGLPPEEFVLIAVPSVEDGNKLFNGSRNIGGKYEHRQRRIIARDIGGTLRHEFVHALHYGHMERLGLKRPHPLWVQEGLATLYEDYVVESDGSFTFLPNVRHNIAQNLAKRNRLRPWEDLFATKPKAFMARASQHYPQVRSIFEYIAEQGRLGEWYQTFVVTFDEDPTGMLAFEKVFERPAEEVERDWKSWLLARPQVDMRLDMDDAVLGVEVMRTAGTNSGVEITRIMRGSAAARTRMREGDVIVAINGEPVRTYRELRTVISRRQAGEEVEVRLRRGEHYFAIDLVLESMRHLHY